MTAALYKDEPSSIAGGMLNKGEIESNYVEEGFAALSFEDGIEAEDVTVDMDEIERTNLQKRFCITVVNG